MKNNRHKILLVDDSADTLEILERNLDQAGYHVQTSQTVENAIKKLIAEPFDLVITDLKMPKSSGLDLIKYVRENIDDMEIMMITGYPCISGAVQAIKDGAEDYLVKPFTDEELLSAVHKVMDKLMRSRKLHCTEISKESYGIIGESKEITKVFRWIEKAASTSVNVLISGESGTGKELVARAIHYNSDRRSAPFVPVNCTAIPDNLIESELFGHVKGAFTGANSNRTGFFKMADGGTIFLDEIGDASMNLQGKLLRVIQNKEILMLGSSRVHKIDTRIIAATHKDLPELVKKGLFREDLFYRINIVDILIPALHERQSDILILLPFFVEKLSKEMQKKPIMFSDKAIQILTNYKWPGNVRELENLIQKLVVIKDGDTIDVSDLPEVMRSSFNISSDENKTLIQVEREHIYNVLNSVDGNKTKAAKILNIDRKTLREKLKSSYRL
ncbi:MAG: sigma-54-dependent Fis family transcriptional regulator [Candidatus Magnetomorum sp.]|nr:sigma-54-dependent Fis family transcriptional regulator [Candidatus Magnetomorum sp.]